MNAQRFAFTVVRVEDGITVTMNCGDGVYRARNMPADFLRVLVTACRQIRADIIDVCRADTDRLELLPRYPQSVTIGGGKIGPCDLRVVASETDKGTVEFAAAFYDGGDDSAPALLLVDDQIELFIDQAEAVLAAPADTSD